MENVLEFGMLGDFPDADVEEAILMEILARQERRKNYPRFNFDTLEPAECKHLFRFEKDDLPRLVAALEIPEEIITETRLHVSGLEALCIVVRRFAYPNRLADLEPQFGLAPQSLSEVFNYTVRIIFDRHSNKLQDLNQVNWLTNEKLKYYSQATRLKGSPLQNCWAFIDGTIRPICRPTENQEDYYSGHKRVHCIKFQSLLCPDGVIINLKGPYPGRRHDAGICRESQLYRELEQKAIINNEVFVIYGDQAYSLQQLLIRPYSQFEVEQDRRREEFNRKMSLLRQSVEWGFKKICQQFAFMDFKKNVKLLKQDVGDMFVVAVLLTNCHTCLYGSQTAQYFNVRPPLLEDYLA